MLLLPVLRLMPRQSIGGADALANRFCNRGCKMADKTSFLVTYHRAKIREAVAAFPCACIITVYGIHMHIVMHTVAELWQQPINHDILPVLLIQVNM